MAAVMTSAEPDLMFRKAQAADAASIAGLTEAAYSQYIPLLGRKPQPMMADYEKIVEY
jgi:predicted transcriptional regulator